MKTIMNEREETLFVISLWGRLDVEWITPVEPRRQDVSKMLFADYLAEE